MRSIEDELRSIDDELRSIDDELRSSEDELRSSDDELRSSDDELRSSDDEVRSLEDVVRRRSASAQKQARVRAPRTALPARTPPATPRRNAGPRRGRFSKRFDEKRGNVYRVTDPRLADR